MKNLKIPNIRGQDLNSGLRDLDTALQYSLNLSHTHIRTHKRACGYSTRWALSCVASYYGVVSFFCSVHEHSILYGNGYKPTYSYVHHEVKN